MTDISRPSDDDKEKKLQRQEQLRYNQEMIRVQMEDREKQKKKEIEEQRDMERKEQERIEAEQRELDEKYKREKDWEAEQAAKKKTEEGGKSSNGIEKPVPTDPKEMRAQAQSTAAEKLLEAQREAEELKRQRFLSKRAGNGRSEVAAESDVMDSNASNKSVISQPVLNSFDDRPIKAAQTNNSGQIPEYPDQNQTQPDQETQQPKPQIPPKKEDAVGDDSTQSGSEESEEERRRREKKHSKKKSSQPKKSSQSRSKSKGYRDRSKRNDSDDDASDVYSSKESVESEKAQQLIDELERLKVDLEKERKQIRKEIKETSARRQPQRKPAPETDDDQVNYVYQQQPAPTESRGRIGINFNNTVAAHRPLISTSTHLAISEPVDRVMFTDETTTMRRSDSMSTIERDVHQRLVDARDLRSQFQQPEIPAAIPEGDSL